MAARFRWIVPAAALCACQPLNPAPDARATDAAAVADDADAAAVRDAVSDPDASGACGSDVTLAAGIVLTDRGAVRGSLVDGAYSYRGIPYAAPPIGPLRWRAPQPAACWAGVRDATSFGPMCAQLDPSGQFVGSEDCLALNVWTPEPRAAAPLPVLVFLHGGDNIEGSSSDQEFGGYLLDGRWLAARGPAVVVTLDYRLGAFGFLSDGALRDASGAAGNYGLEDQLAALAWVQRNAAAFGGDPSRVMLFGHSAGGVDTCALLASPLGAGLFSRALMQSGPCEAGEATLAATTAQSAERTLGCTASADVAACLRAQPATSLAHLPGAAVGSANPDGARYDVVIDGHVLTDAPIRVIRAGRHNHVPVVLGTTRNEYELLIDLLVPSFPTDAAGYATTIQGLFGPTYASAIAAHYPLASYGGASREAFVAMIGDYLMHCPVRRTARALAASQTEPVRRYVFSHVFESQPVARDLAAHGLDVPFVFHTFGTLTPASDELALSQSLGGAWTQVAASADASPGIPWPTYNSAGDTYLDLDVASAPADGMRTTECDFWDTLAPDGT